MFPKSLQEKSSIQSTGFSGNASGRKGRLLLGGKYQKQPKVAQTFDIHLLFWKKNSYFALLVEHELLMSELRW